MKFLKSPEIDSEEYTLSHADFQASPDQASKIFSNFGFLYISNAVNDDPALISYHRNLKRIILEKIGRLGLPFDSTSSMDEIFNTLCDHNRKLGSGVFDVAREVEGFLGLINHPKILGVCRFLLEAEILHIPFDKAMFRIDRPEERWSEFHWHQDYTYNVMSCPTITTWSPLTDVSSDMGALCVIPKSHGRFYPVELRDKPALNGISNYKAAHIKQYTQQEMDSWAMEIPVKRGDILFFHQNLVHRSGHNQSNRSRWVFTARYGNAIDCDLVDRNWKIERSTDFSTLASVESGGVTSLEKLKG